MRHRTDGMDHNDLILNWKEIPVNCHGWGRRGYGAVEFISHESITSVVAIDILSLEAK